MSGLRAVCLAVLTLTFLFSVPALSMSQSERRPFQAEPQQAPPPNSSEQKTTILPPDQLGPNENAAPVCGGPPGVGWVCVEQDDAATGDPSANEVAAARRGAPPRSVTRRRAEARAAATYSFHSSRTVYYGIGGTQIGSFQRNATVNFNARQGRVFQSGNVLTGRALRYDFQETTFRGGGHGTVANNFRDIRPAGGQFSTLFVAQPSHYPYHNYNQYHIHYNLDIRARGVSNPSSPTGTFAAPLVSTPYYYCGSGLCYFP